MKRITLTTILTGLLHLPFVAAAAGISVSPSSLEFSKTNQAQQLVVTNPTSDVQIFEVSVNEFKNLIAINPASFTLEAGANRQVEIKLENNSQLNNQVMVTNLSVLGRPLLEERFEVNTGVKIPLTVNLESDPSQDRKYDPILITLGLLIVIAVALTVKKFKLVPKQRS